MANDRVRFLFAEVDEFKSLLNDATTEAASDWEIEFCKDMNERFDRYQGDMFITDAQLSKLRTIAKVEE
jgi:hypothetical protein